MAKILRTHNIEDFEIWTDTGWEDLTAVHKTVEYDVWETKTTKGRSLKSADCHILFDENYNEVFVQDLKKGDKVLTEDGPEEIEINHKLDVPPEHMYDVSVGCERQRFYSDGFLSHNSTLMTIYALWIACFFTDQTIVLVANKEATASNIFKRIRMAYEQLPNFLKPGIKDYAKTGMTLANDSTIMVSTTTATSIRGLSISCLPGDQEITLKSSISGQLCKKTLQQLFDDNSCGFLKHFVSVSHDWLVQTKSGWSPFRGIRKIDPTHPILRITHEEGVLRCTSDHLVWSCAANGFVTAESLTAGQSLLHISGKEVSITKIETETSKEPVYDVVDTEDHTFIANDVVVHNCLLIDELAFIGHELIEEFWSSVIPTVSSGKKTKIFAVSTPNGTTGKFYEIYSGAEKKANGWGHDRIDWWEVPGRDEKWKKDMITALGSEDKFNVEFGNTFVESGSTAVGAALIEKFKREKKPPIWESEDKEYRIFEPPSPEKLYVIGVDVGEGIGRASSVAQVLDVTDLADIKQVATFGSAMLEPHFFASKLVALGYCWGAPPILVERNNCGAQVIDAMYYDHGYEKIASYSKVISNNKHIRTRCLGVLSHTNVRFEGIQNMRYWMNHLGVVTVHDTITISEFETFIKHPNGQYRKKNELFYDDRVLSLVWALFILHEEVATQWFDVISYDSLNKPSKLGLLNFYDAPDPSEYKICELNPREILNAHDSNWFGEEEHVNTSTGVAVAPMDPFMNRGDDEDEEDLWGQGYTPWGMHA